MDKNFYWFALSNIKNIGSRTLLNIFEKNRALKLTIPEFFELSPRELEEKYALSKQIISSIVNIKHSVNIKELYDQIIQKDIKIITLEDSEYPAQLKNIKSPPFIIYTYGNIEILTAKNVVIAGSRNISLDGLNLVYKFAELLLTKKISIIRGDTTKVDTLTYLATTQIEYGNEVIVLSEGILKFYQMLVKKNKKIDTTHQLVLSFVKPLFHWTTYAEKERNRIIFNLSNVIIIIEARDEGIIMTEALEALKMNKQVFVVKYATPPISASGNNKLIERGAIPIAPIDGLDTLMEVVATALKY